MSAASLRHYPFPSAVHSYFALTNRVAQKRQFISGNIQNPTFEYKLRKTEQDIEAYRRMAMGDASTSRRLELVQTSLMLQHNEKALGAFRAANSALYAVPNVMYTKAILSNYGARATQVGMQHLWNEVQDRIGEKIPLESFSIGPSSELFLQYKRYLAEYTQLPPRELVPAEAIQFQLDAVGLSEKGWRVRLLKADEHAHTYHRAKTISIGSAYTARSKEAAIRIAAHEVIGHALRGSQPLLAESEGVAIMLEQLTGERFKLRRSYRYLAIALGWGVIAPPMAFREVYEVLWRLMLIAGGRTEESAKSHAYDECCRAFRGGRPDLPGAVFLKDAVYFDATIRVWEVLVDQKLSYNEFVDLIEGRRTLLS